MKLPKLPFFSRLSFFFLPAIAITTMVSCARHGAVPVADALTRSPEHYEQHSELFFNALAGTILLRQNSAEDAIPYYQKVAQQSDDLEVLENILLLALGQKHYESAVPIAEKIVELSPAPRQQLRQNLVLLYAQTKMYDKALRVLNAIAKDDADGDFNQNAFLELSALLAQQADNYAIQFTQELIKKFPDQPVAHLTHAVLALQLRQFPTALESIDRALAQDLDEKIGTLIKAHIFISDKQVDEGISFIKAQLERNADNAKLRNYYAAYLLTQEDYRQAHEQYLTLHALLPQDPQILRNAGHAAIQIPDLDVAKKHFNALLGWTEHHTEASYYMGRIAEQQEFFFEALRWYQGISAQTPRLFLEALLRRAHIHHLRGQNEQALLLLSDNHSLIEDAGLLTRVYQMQGDLLNKVKRYQEAYQTYSDGLNATSVNNADLLFARALVSFEMKNLSAAENDLKKILSKNPNNSMVLNALGYMLADMNVRLDEAKQYIERAYQLEPDEAAIIDSMGWLAYRLNNLDEAEKFLRIALARDEQPEILGHLVEVLLKKGLRPAAHNLLRRGLVKFPNDEYLLRLNRQIST